MCAFSSDSQLLRRWTFSILAGMLPYVSPVVVSATGGEGHESPNAPRPEAATQYFTGLYVDHDNQVRIGGSIRPIALEDATNELLRGTETDDIRGAVKAMRQSMAQLNCEIQGTKLRKNGDENHGIAVRRAFRDNMHYRRFPTDNDADRTVVAGRPVKQPPYPESEYYTDVLRISPEEEEGMIPTDFGGIWVKTHRYSRRTFDPTLAARGLQDVEARLMQKEACLAELMAMKKQLARCLVKLEGELTYRSRFGASETTARSQDTKGLISSADSRAHAAP